MPARKWKTEFLVNTTTAGIQQQSSVTALADGGFVITWVDDAPTDSVIRWQRYDAAGMKLGAEQTILNTVGDQTLPDVVQLNDGNLWFVMQDFDSAADDDLDGFVYSLTGAFVRSQDPQAAASVKHQDGASASLGPNGSVSVFYSASDNAGDINMTLYGATGNTILFDVTVNSTTAGTQSQPEVAASPDGTKFVVTWLDGALGIRARVFDNAGTPAADEFPIILPGANTPIRPNITWLGNDRFVATWAVFEGPPSADSSGSAIKYAIFNANGTALGLERLANSTVTNLQQFSAITALPDGGFVIAWMDTSATGGDTSSQAIRLQVFDGVGDKRGGEILVNTTTFGDQFDVSLATLADGRVIVSWTDGGTGGDVRAQIIDPRDGIIDGTGGVDTLYGHDSVGDVIFAGDGADTVFGLAGADSIHGGAGIDILNGGRGDDTIFGGTEGDNLRGDAGDDELYGEAGGDTLLGGLGADFLNGGDGTDFANYHFSTGVTVDMNAPFASTGEAFGDSFFSIEGLVGSASAADILRGDTNDNLLYGQGGADTLDGRGGGDLLYGGAGIDILTGGTGPDKFRYVAASEGGDTITDYEASDDFQFVRAAFGNLTGANVAAVNFLSVASGNAATTANHRFIFDQALDQLWYDADGSAGGAAVLIADLNTNINLTHLDLLLI